MQKSARLIELDTKSFPSEKEMYYLSRWISCLPCILIAQVRRAFSRGDRRQDGSLKHKQIAIRRRAVLLSAVSSGDKVRSKGFKRQKVRLRPVIKGFFVPVSPGRDRLGIKNPPLEIAEERGRLSGQAMSAVPFRPVFPLSSILCTPAEPRLHSEGSSRGAALMTGVCCCL